MGAGSGQAIPARERPYGVDRRSGQEALETFRREPVDLVITDRAIPDMSGDRIAAEIKRLSPAMPVVMLTGLGDIMDVRREKPAGVHS